VAKFFPHYDGPHVIIDVHSATSSYTLELPNSPNIFPTFYASKLKHFFKNDATLFPSQELPQLGPILTSDGLEEFQVQEIIDSHWRGRGYLFLVQWTGYGADHDQWLSTAALNDCEVLDGWLISGGDGLNMW
jgi:hypothetical protein